MWTLEQLILGSVAEAPHGTRFKTSTWFQNQYLVLRPVPQLVSLAFLRFSPLNQGRRSSWEVPSASADSPLLESLARFFVTPGPPRVPRSGPLC